MSNQEKKLSASGLELPDVESDRLDDLLLEMFLKKEMESLSNLDDVQLQQLTGAARRGRPQSIGHDREFGRADREDHDSCRQAN